MCLAGHSRMNAGHSLEADDADDETVDQANHCSAIPGWPTKEMQDHNVEQRKEPAYQQVKQEAEATKKRAEAEVDAVKADLAYRQAYVELMSLVGK